MVINHNKTGLQRVADVEVPDAFFHRMHTGIKQIDELYGGEGILPGSIATVAAAPGSGKTTLYLQVCQALSNQGYSAAYITGEESTEMIAYTCRRLNITDVLVACETELDNIVEFMEDVDFIVYDSFPCLTVDGKRMNRTGQEQAISNIVRAAKTAGTAMSIILHVTKSGGYKGSTTIPHAVDMNMSIEVDSEDPSVRYISTDKNRYGSLAEVSTYFGYKGFDFDKKVESSGKMTKAESKGGKKAKELQAIKSLKEPPGITVSRVCQALKVDANRANYLLRGLVQEGALEKFGRGQSAVWKHTNV
jgi:predicted ATP-dependent serine protease